jgi:hypothetical protein
MNYWFDAFTGITWNEFRAAGAKVTGFREHNWKRAERIRPGDIFLCYLVGVKRWVGLLEVRGERYRDQTPIWGEEVFPVRFPVKPLVMLDAEFGVPMKDMEGKLSFFPQGGKKWSGWVRSSPTRYEPVNGDVIVAALKAFQQQPMARPVDAKLLARSSNLYKLKKKGAQGQETIVSVPTDDAEDNEAEVTPAVVSTHTEIQWRLLELGSRMGLRVWAPKADRGRSWNGDVISRIENLLDSLPTQFDEVTQRTIENIDVLWLSGNAIVAAFEVEHSTSIYSGLLRMSDLLTMQPNIDIKLYLVAPEERHNKFRNEVARATFAASQKPLHQMCGFLSYGDLCQRLDKATEFLPYMKPEFIDEIAEYYDPAEEFDA